MAHECSCPTGRGHNGAQICQSEAPMPWFFYQQPILETLSQVHLLKSRRDSPGEAEGPTTPGSRTSTPRHRDALPSAGPPTGATGIPAPDAPPRGARRHLWQGSASLGQTTRDPFLSRLYKSCRKAVLTIWDFQAKSRRSCSGRRSSSPTAQTLPDPGLWCSSPLEHLYSPVWYFIPHLQNGVF